MNALAQATFDLRPFIGGDNPRNNIERKNLLRAGLIAIHVESDTHSKQSLLGRLLIPAEFLIAYGGDALKQQAGARSWCSVGTEHLIVKTAGLVSVEKHEKSVRSPEARGRPRPSTLLYCAELKIKSRSFVKVGHSGPVYSSRSRWWATVSRTEPC